MKLYLFELGLVAGVHPVPGYLIQTGDGGYVLVDTGVRPPAQGEPPHPFLQARDEQTVLRQLARLGVEPRAIEMMIATHLDEDHAGFIDAFPSAEIVIQQGHRAAIRDLGLPRFDAVRPYWDRPDLHFREVQGDVEVAKGVSVIESGGHVPGHQSVLVELPQTGPVLLAIDAIPHHEMTDAETRVIMPIDLDAARTRASTRKLMELAAARGVKLVVYGHDAVQWPTLRHSPEFYV